MYNEEIKKRFISDFSTGVERQKAAKKMFNALEKYETQLGTDFCAIKEKELIPIVDEVAGGRTRSSVRLYIMRDYIRWCIDNEIEGACQDLFNLKDIGLKKMSSRFLSDPNHLQRYLDYVCYPLDQETSSCLFRCYYWLAFSGIQEKDAFSVKVSDVDIDNLIIKSKGMEFPLYDDAIPALKQCINLERFKVYKSNQSYYQYTNRATGDTLLRSALGTVSIQAMKVESNRKSRNPYVVTIAKGKRDESLELQLCYSRVWISGVFYRTYVLEGMGIAPNFMGLAKLQMEGKEYKLDSCRHNVNIKAKQIAYNYLHDYKMWKRIFSLI